MTPASPDEQQHPPDAAHLVSLIERQSAASAELTEAGSFREFAAILARHFITRGQFLSINVFLYNDDEQFAGFRTLVSANSKDSFEVDHFLYIGLDQVGDPLRDLIANGKAVVSMDVQGDSTIDPRLKEWNEGAPIHSSLLIPMRAHGRTFGLISLNGMTTPIEVAPVEIQMYQVLGDQIGALVQVHRLTEQTTASYDISERQSLVFNQLIAGLTFPDIARVIAHYMLPDQGRFVGINELEYDDQGHVAHWYIRATANRDTSYTWDDIFNFGTADFDSPLHLSVQDGEPYVAGDMESVREADLGPSLYKWAQENKIRSFACVPVPVGIQTAAVLLVMSRKPNAFLRDEIYAFQNIAGQVGALIYVNRLTAETELTRSIVDNLVLVNRLVTTSTDTPQIAQAVMYTVARNQSGAAITVFDRPVPPGQRPGEQRLSGIASDDGIITFDRDAAAIPVPSHDDLEKLHGGLPLTISGEGAATLLPDDLATQLASEPLTWAAGFGLRSGEMLMGSLWVLHTESHDLTVEEIDAYTTLADQIGTVMGSRRLLRESQEAQALASRLIQTNRLISTGRDAAQISQAVVQTMPESVELVGLLVFDQPVIVGELPATITLDVLASREDVDRIDVIDRPDVENLRHRAALERLLEGDALTIAPGQPDPFELTPEATRTMRSRGAESFLTVGLRSGGRLRGMLMFGQRAGSRLGDAQVSNVLAVADQVAITMENRRLLDQTADALSFVQSQYDTTAALYGAMEPLEMLNALYDFTSGAYGVAMIALVDEEDPNLLRVAGEIERGQQRLPDRTIPVEAFMPSAIRERQTTPDGFDDDTLSDADRAKLIQTSGRHELTVPLMAADGGLMGIVRFTDVTDRGIAFNRARALRSLVDQLAIVLQNRRLLQTTADSLQETRMLYEINRGALQAQSGLDVLRVLRDNLAPDAAALSLYNLYWDRTAGQLQSMVREWRIDDYGERPSRVDVFELLPREIMDIYLLEREERGQQIDFIDVIDDDAIARHPGLKNMHDAGIESVVIIPVYVDGLLTYQINIDFVYPQYFDEQVRRVYEAAQDQIVLVLNSQRLLDNTRRQASQLQQIANFSQSIQSTMDIGELLTNALVNAWQVVQMDHLAVMLSDPTTGQLELVAWHDDSAPYVVLGDERPVLMEATTAGHIWQTPAPFQVNDITRQTDSLHYAAAEDMRAVMTVPLYARGVVVGLIETGARETNVYTEIDFIIFQQLAGQLAVAIENAGAYQQSQRLARSKALVNDISSRLQQQTELDNILNLTVNELGRALGARRGRIRLGTQSNGENGTEA